MKRKVILKGDTILGLNEYIRLRREDAGILIYWAAPTVGIEDDEIDTNEVLRLHSSVAMMLALFNGKRPLKEVFQAVKYIWDKPSLTFDNFCQELQKFILDIEPYQFSAPILVEITDNKKQKFRVYDPESFIIEGNKFCDSQALPLKFPIRINLMPVMKCFTNCVYCYMGRDLIEYSPLSFPRWKELLNEMAKYQVAELGFAGGDALCYKHTMDMFDIASTFEPPTCLDIATKAYISQEMARRISRIPMLKFQISLDSTNLEIADAMTRRKGYGKRAIESLKNLLDAGVTPAVKTVVTPATIKAMPQTILDLHKLGVYPIRVAIYNRSLWNHKDELFNKANDWKEFEKQAEEIQSKHDFKIQIQGSGPEEGEFLDKKKKKSWNDRNICTVGKSQITILPDGSLLGCEQIPQKPEYFLGSVAKDSLYDVWNSKSFKEKAYNIPREKYKGTPCYDCKEFTECHSALGKGYCMRDSYALWGTIYAPTPGCPYHDKKHIRMQ